ncbi:MAG: efflux RND transporter periplasmic adaptor subunit [Calditrichaceae bacterium]|nr:efflux RND transporter periplasmic adaptor subunit [Calditrichaceae bacterium]MBN2708617.1 efflux RND transporter periplasmic adaptor subunit [Calditrichaceae bacterium]RQV95467.1 MAG: efflux RND transporter periplasmic adaptor subunit [Calditrichota bacterium]
MKSRILFIVLLAALVFYGCSGDDQDDVEKSVPVIVYEVTSKPISKYIRATGSVEGDEDVILYSKVAERVERINVVPGQKVAKNQILVQQKNDMLKQGLEIANASLKTAKGQAELTAIDFERMNKLYAEKAISPQQYDQAKIAKETAEHAYQQAKSMYEQAYEQYENSFIKAPFDGVVAAVYVKKDQMINMGQPVVQILSPSKMKAKVYLTGNDIQNVKIDQNVIIKFPVIPGEEFTGRVNKINTAIDQLTKTLEVEIEVISKDNRIKSGIFGEFFIEIENKPNSLIVPETSLIPQTEIKIDRETGLQNTFKKYYTYILENHKAKIVEVKTGIANNGQIEITDGLSKGDSVIVVGQNIVKDGQTVNVIE